MSNLAGHMFRQAEANADKTALRYEDQSFSFMRIADEVRRIAGGLASIGIGTGTHVGLMASSCPEFIFFQHAIFARGAVFTPLNIFYRQNEILHAIQSCGLEYLIVGAEFVDRMPASGDPALGKLRSVIVLTDEEAIQPGGFQSSGRILASSPPISAPTSVPESAVAMMLSTSATTGKSKGVMLTVGNIQANYDRTPAWLGLTSDTVTLCALPLYNTFGLNQCINALMVTGGSLILMPKFDAQLCLELIQRHHCTFLPAVPTMLQKILDHPEASNFDLRSIERIMTGGAPVPAALLERVHDKIGANTVLFTGYGIGDAGYHRTGSRRQDQTAEIDRQGLGWNGTEDSR
jgi:long-chain acyl-CoA synthetase